VRRTLSTLIALLRALQRFDAARTDERQPVQPPAPTARPSRRRLRWSRRLTVVVAVGVLATAAGVFAYFTSQGSGTASAGVSSLSTPGSVAASTSGATVHVTWSASSINGTVAATSYLVERYTSAGADLGAAGCSPVPSSAGIPNALGSFSCTDNPGSSSYKYKVTARYNNSWTATSGFTNTVTPGSSTTTLVSSANPSVSGQQVTFTATVTVSPSGTPTGKVAFYDGATAIAACGGATGVALSGTAPFQATCQQTYAASGGNHTITAQFLGDANYPSSSSAPLTQVVNKASQTITFTSSAPSNAKVGGGTYTPTATGGGSGNPVTLTIDASASSVCSISGGVVSFQTVGTCVIDANQAGDGDYFAASQTQQSFAVAKGDQTITFGALANKRFDQSPITVSATGGGSGNPVTFSSTTPSVCTSGGTNGATITFVSGANVTCTVKADQAGNANWNAAPSVSQSFTITPGNQTISFTSTAPGSAKVGGATYTPTATATSGLAVTLTIDASASSVCSISGGVVSFQTVGTCVIDANQAGNANWNAAPQVQQSFTVAKGDQTISFTNPGAKTFDQSPITVSATGGGSGNPVTFSSATTSVCTAGGTNGATITFVTVGTCTINADQAGNSNWNAATQVQQSFTINKGNQTISFTNPGTKTFDQGPITLTAAASSGLAVTFTSATTSVCTAGGTNGATITFVTVGTCTIDADQAGNSNWNAATQVQQSFTISKGNQTISFNALANQRLDQSPVTASASASSGLTVTFSSTTTSVCTVSGTTITLVHVGTCTINADQAGNNNWNAAPTVAQSFTVSKGNQTITFPALSNVRLDQTPPTPNATASSNLAVTYSTASTACSVTSAGAITLLHAGSCAINADQAGNADWNAATRVTQTFTINKGNQTISFGAAPAFARTGVSGSSVSATATSGLAVTYGSSTSSICTVNSSSGALTLLTIGQCTITADQAGNSDWNAATQATQSFQVYNGSVTGLVWTSTSTSGSGLSCTGSGTTSVDCTASGGNNATITGTIAFSNSSGTPTVFSAQAQSMPWSQTGKGTASGTSTVNANQSTASASVTAQKNGSNAAVLTLTFTTPGGTTWTATLHIN